MGPSILIDGDAWPPTTTVVGTGFNGAVDSDQRRQEPQIGCGYRPRRFNGAVDSDRRRPLQITIAIQGRKLASMRPSILIDGDSFKLEDVYTLSALQWGRRF